jgi:hypothetical protein
MSRGESYLAQVTSENKAVHEPSPLAWVADTVPRELPRPGGHGARDGVGGGELGHGPKENEVEDAEQRPSDELSVSTTVTDHLEPNTKK